MPGALSPLGDALALGLADGVVIKDIAIREGAPGERCGFDMGDKSRNAVSLSPVVLILRRRGAERKACCGKALARVLGISTTNVSLAE